MSKFICNENRVGRDVLVELFSYDQNSGILIRRVDRGGILAGTKVGCLRPDGYLCVAINKRLAQVHRVVWCMHYGDWPDKVIDHINGDRSDNRIANLRNVSQSINILNQIKSRRSALGLRGVDQLPNGNFRARVKGIGRSSNHLGVFATADLALAASNEARSKILEVAR